MKCSKCKQVMEWQEGLLCESGSRDYTIGKFYCLKCRVFSSTKPSKAIMRGKKLEKTYKNLKWDDPKILCLSVAEQIGLLRERQKGLR